MEMGTTVKATTDTDAAAPPLLDANNISVSIVDDAAAETAPVAEAMDIEAVFAPVEEAVEAVEEAADAAEVAVEVEAPVVGEAVAMEGGPPAAVVAAPPAAEEEAAEERMEEFSPEVHGVGISDMGRLSDYHRESMPDGADGADGADGVDCADGEGEEQEAEAMETVETTAETGAAEAMVEVATEDVAPFSTELQVRPRPSPNPAPLL
jgi:hypothetical protein